MHPKYPVPHTKMAVHKGFCSHTIAFPLAREDRIASNEDLSNFTVLGGRSIIANQLEVRAKKGTSLAANQLYLLFKWQRLLFVPKTRDRYLATALCHSIGSEERRRKLHRPGAPLNGRERSPHMRFRRKGSTGNSDTNGLVSTIWSIVAARCVTVTL